MPPEPHAIIANKGFHTAGKLEQTGHNIYQMQLNGDVA